MEKITEGEARRIASEWHSGQWSPLYAFSSSGIIEDKGSLLSEVEYCLTITEDTDELERLESLAQFVRDSDDTDNT